MPLPAPVHDVALLLARLLVGAVLVAHGWDKLAGQGVTATADFLGSLGVPAPEVAAVAVGVLALPSALVPSAAAEPVITAPVFGGVTTTAGYGSAVGGAPRTVNCGSPSVLTSRDLGPAPERAVALDLVKRGLLALPVALLLGFAVWGTAGLASVAFGAALVLANFWMSAALLG